MPCGLQAALPPLELPLEPPLEPPLVSAVNTGYSLRVDTHKASAACACGGHSTASAAGVSECCGSRVSNAAATGKAGPPLVTAHPALDPAAGTATVTLTIAPDVAKNWVGIAFNAQASNG